MAYMINNAVDFICSSSGTGKGLDVRRGLTQSERSDKHHEEHLKTHKPVLSTATFFFSLTLI